MARMEGYCKVNGKIRVWTAEPLSDTKWNVFRDGIYVGRAWRSVDYPETWDGFSLCGGIVPTKGTTLHDAIIGIVSA